MADHRLAAQDRRVGVHHHLVLQRRVSLHAADDLAGAVARERQGAQRHTLVELDVLADVARLADHHPRAVVDEEPRTDPRPRMDVDARLRVGVLGHHPRDVRDPEGQELVGDPVDGDRLQARVAEDDLVVAPGGRVATVGGVDVPVEHVADGRQALQELDCLALGKRFEVDVRGLLAHVVAQGPGDLGTGDGTGPPDPLEHRAFVDGPEQARRPRRVGLGRARDVGSSLRRSDQSGNFPNEPRGC